MLGNINEELKRRNFNRQSIGEGDNSITVPNLMQRVKDGFYKTKEVNIDLSVYNLSNESFSCDTLFDFLVHYKLIENAKLKYPVILNNHGAIIDGRHRLCKALIKGKKTLKGIMIMDDYVI